MTVDTLNTLVSSAIWRAEQLQELGLETACLAWREVSTLEEQLASLLPAKEAEGGIARRGAIRAALKAHDHARATELARRFASERGAPRALRTAFDEILAADAHTLAEDFPSAARHYTTDAVQGLAAHLLQHGAFGLAA